MTVAAAFHTNRSQVELPSFNLFAIRIGLMAPLDAYEQTSANTRASCCFEEFQSAQILREEEVVMDPHPTGLQLQSSKRFRRF